MADNNESKEVLVDIVQSMDGEQASEEVVSPLEQIVSQAVEEFQVMSAEDQQSALFSMTCDRLYWRLVYYVRRYPERLASSADTYSDKSIGVEEFMKYMGHVEEDGYASKWLQFHHVPSLDEAIENIIPIEAQLNAVYDLKTTDCPMLRMMHSFGLNHSEMAVLSLLVVAMSVEDLFRMMIVAWADFTQRLPSVTFMCDLLSDTPNGFKEIYQTFSENGVLRRMRLVVTETNPSMLRHTPLAYASLAVEQPVIDVFCGRSMARELLPGLAIHRTPMPKKSLICDSGLAKKFQNALSHSQARIFLTGAIHSGRRTMACAFYPQMGYDGILEVDMRSSMEETREGLAVSLASIMREALMERSLLMLRFDGLEDGDELFHHLVKYENQLKRLVQSYPGTILVLSQKFYPILGDIFDNPVNIHVELPSVEISRKVWQLALKPCTDSANCERMAEMFSINYRLPVGSIFSAVQSAVDALRTVSSGKGAKVQSHHILNEIRKGFRHQLGTLADISVSNVPLSGVVLKEDARAQVNEILAYSKNLNNVLDEWGFRERSPYGNSLSALFVGPPGTGKTLLANALANELGKVLYRVDLSRVVDKYIGETEKNLAKIFDEADKAQAIILFDEADSLFTKRTEVKSSNDRHANLEVNYLLQKLESYSGITILTTNLEKGIDEAFRRRLRFIIEFPMPDVSDRVALWKRMMPPNAPLSDDIRWKWLAQTFEMSGGYIRNAVLKAAIAASAASEPISMSHLVKAAKEEARSVGQLMRIDDDFEDYEDYDDDDE